MAKRRNLNGKFKSSFSQTVGNVIFHAEMYISSEFVIRLSFLDMKKITNKIVEIKTKREKRILLHNALSATSIPNFLFKLKMLSTKIDRFIELVASEKNVIEFAKLNYTGYGSGSISILNADKISRLSIADCNYTMNYLVTKSNTQETKQMILFLSKLSIELQHFIDIIEAECIRIDKKNEIARANREFKKVT